MTSELTQVAKDFLKRKVTDIGRSCTQRLKTPMDMAILSLRAHQILPSSIIALEVFGMHGILTTSEYAPLCDYLELWEINPFYAKCAKKFIPKATVKVGDSIDAVKRGVLLRKDYNFIVIDNPVLPFGSGRYCEHFDLFPYILDNVKEKAIIIMNVVYDVAQRQDKISPSSFEDWMVRRKEFYGSGDIENINVGRLMEIYRKKFEQWQTVAPIILFIPRGEGVGFIIIQVLRGEYASHFKKK